ncbi:hypothetical protein KAU88_01485 [Candidatus Bathyarchaeota archaeon]|nr:hypothetical protein [Candidatus Bathyarchaeota archaeon]
MQLTLAMILPSFSGTLVDTQNARFVRLLIDQVVKKKQLCWKTRGIFYSLETVS